MKVRVVSLASNVSALGWGIVVSKLADMWGWGIGFGLIGLGIVGFIVVAFWDKLKYLVNAKYRRWRKIPSGTVLSQEESETGSKVIPKIKKEVKKL
jgi:hypothetical protein